MPSNLPKEALKWDLPKAATEFGEIAQTLRNRLNQINALPDDQDCYTTKQLLECLFGSQALANLRHTQAQTESVALKNRALKAELLDRGEVTASFENVMVAVRNIIEGSSLSDQERDDILNNIATWPIILDNVATQQIGPSSIIGR